jgi:signal transduction histidine kinase
VVRLVEQGGHVEVTVTDSGRGVPPGMEETIFTDGFTTKANVGHRNQGLGLALVHRLVHQGGGTIDLRRDPTTFVVTLPMAGTGEVGLSRQPTDGTHSLWGAK